MIHCGIDRIEEFSHILFNKRLGLVMRSSGIGRDYCSSIEILHEKCNLTPLNMECAASFRAGVQIHVLDHKAVKPVALGVKIIRTLQKLYPNEFRFKEPENGRYHIDVETGTDEVRLNEEWKSEAVFG